MTTTSPLSLTPRQIPLLVPGSEEHRRQHSISASTVACLFGVHPFLDVRTLAAIKRGEIEDTAGEAAETGNVLEDVVAQWWADKHGVTVVKPEWTYSYGEPPILTASPDRIIHGCTDTILEVKTTSKEEGTVLPYWWWQVQAQMACTGAEKVVLAVLWGGSLTLRDYTIGRDEAAIEEMCQRASVFLAYLEDGLQPPDPSPRDPAVETVKVGKLEADELADLAAWRATEREAKAKADEIKRRMEALLGGPGLEVGSRLSIVHEGKAIYRLRKQRGRERMAGTGEFNEPFCVLEAE